MAIKDYEFWFIVGTQHLYGEEIFADINSHAQDMCDEWSKKLPCKVVAKPCVKTSSEILNVIEQANNTPNCAGIITWMHTFSPSKMWISGHLINLIFTLIHNIIVTFRGILLIWTS